MKKFIIIRYGTEVRIFFNEFFSKRNGVFYAIIKNPGSKNINNYLSKYNVDPIFIDRFPRIRSRLLEWFNSIRSSRNKIIGIKNYKHYSKANNHITIKDYCKGNILVYYSFQLVLNIYLKYIYTEKDTVVLPKQKSEVYFGGYSSYELIAFASLTERENCRNIAVVNSWKDFYVNNFVPLVFHELWVWNEKMKWAYVKTNPFFNKKNVLVKGNPRMTALFQHIPTKSKEYYWNKFCIRKSSFVLYTAINPRVYENEPDIIMNLLDFYPFSLGYHLLIKTNPMDPYPERWRKLSENYENVTVLFSDWTWDKDNEFNVPDMESEIEWFDILKYCTATCNVASTVTIESLISRKPVINICFDEFNRVNKIFRELTYSDFYSDVIGRNDVIVTNSFQEFEEAMQSIHIITAGDGIEDLICLS